MPRGNLCNIFCQMKRKRKSNCSASCFTAFRISLQKPLVPVFFFVFFLFFSFLISSLNLSKPNSDFSDFFICSWKGKKVSGSFSASSQAAGGTTGLHTFSSKMKCHVLSLRYVHMHTHKLFPNEIGQYCNLMQQTSEHTLLSFTEGLSSPRQSGFIHYVLSTL